MSRLDQLITEPHCAAAAAAQCRRRASPVPVPHPLGLRRFTTQCPYLVPADPISVLEIAAVSSATSSPLSLFPPLPPSLPTPSAYSSSPSRSPSSSSSSSAAFVLFFSSSLSSLFRFPFSSAAFLTSSFLAASKNASAAPHAATDAPAPSPSPPSAPASRFDKKTNRTREQIRQFATATGCDRAGVLQTRRVPCRTDTAGEAHA
eukprot:1845392-Rhodomonas_salina.1